MKQKVLLPVSCVLWIAMPGVTLSFCLFELPGEMFICFHHIFTLNPQNHNILGWKVSKMQ